MSVLHFTFKLPCIAIDLFLNNQADALITQIYSVIKLYMFQASSLPIIRNSLLYIRHWQASCRFDDRFQAVRMEFQLQFHPDSAFIKNLHETYQCRMYSRKLLTMGTEDARNM
jgi:hypothetical protein